MKATNFSMDTEANPKGTSEFSNATKHSLGIDFTDQEQETSLYTKDGSVDRHGNPAVKRRTGGWRCAMLLLVNQGLVTLAFAGVEVNLVLFSKSVLRQTNAEAANTFSIWMGTTYLCSLVGAFLSDSYLGRYRTCLIFQVVCIIGLVMLTLSTQTFLLRPQGCGIIGSLCEPQKPIEMVVFYISLYLIAMGNGAPEPALATFGADQFDEEDSKENKSKNSFYSYFYVALNMGSLFSETILVYLETMGNWVLGYWVCVFSAVVAYYLLLTGSFRYRHFKPCGNPISRFAQVIVASVRNMNLQLPINGEGLYDVQGKPDEFDGVRRIHHTSSFKFLDRAAIISPEDMSLIPDKGNPRNSWHICSVTQIEEVKCILRLLPIWLCTIFSSVLFIQMLSLFVEQGASMDRTVISGFHIPPASMTVFDIVSTSLFIVFYDYLIVPCYLKLTKREPKTPSELQRIGIGLTIGIIAMITAALVEKRRVRFAVNGEESSSLSIFWQTPQYVLVGVSEALVYVSQMEFFASETPYGLKSLGMGLSMSSSAIGSYIATLIMTVVMKITTKDGKPGWVPPNLNDGHLDRFFFLCAGLTAINLCFYVLCARRYNGIMFEKRQETNIEEEVHKALIQS